MIMPLFNLWAYPEEDQGACRFKFGWISQLAVVLNVAQSMRVRGLKVQLCLPVDACVTCRVSRCFVCDGVVALVLALDVATKPHLTLS